MAATLVAAMIGQTLGHYRIVEKIGAGGMGEVYRARDERLERDVAIKVLPAGTLADQGARKHFRKEALALARLNHPNIETLYDFDTQDVVDFLVMEYIPGVTLSDRLVVGPLPEKDATRLGSQLAEGLAAAHDQGVLHRDLKPGNLRILPDGRLKILDFGLAQFFRPDVKSALSGSRANTQTLTETPATAGTLPYMAPEQLREEKTDERSDIYGAGCVLYEMATSRRAFPEAHVARLIDLILNAVPIPPRRLRPDLSLELERIISKCLDRDPDRRYQSARELRVDLERASSFTPAARIRGKAAFARQRRRTSPKRIQALAVLPLQNLSYDPEQDYFTEGMTEAMITELAKIGALRVISRTSVMHYKGVKKPLSEIARELNVDAVVEGSVLRAGERVRISAQLLEAATDQHLWAESYEGDLRDILALQKEVARAIAREIKITLTPEEKARLASARPVDPQAYQRYLQGRYYWNKRTEEAFRKGIEYFQQAIQKDPGYAPAYAGLADCYVLLGAAAYGGLPPRETIPKGKAAALKALEIDETLADAYATLGYAGCQYYWHWAESERAFHRALELNPRYATAHHWYSIYLSVVGRHEEAVGEAERAVELDPLSLIINAGLGIRFHYARQDEKGIRQLRKILEMDSNFAAAHDYLGRMYVQMKKYDEAIKEFEKAKNLSGGTPLVIAELGCVYGLAGNHGEALKVLGKLEHLSRQRYVSPAVIAFVYEALGDKDRALEWLEKAYEGRDTWLAYLRVDPRWDKLRDTPHFQDLLHRMNFPD